MDDREEVQRRSVRERTTRYVEVDGYTVLKLNNYSLDDGEGGIGAEIETKKRRRAAEKRTLDPMASVWRGVCLAPCRHRHRRQDLYYRCACV